MVTLFVVLASGCALLDWQAVWRQEDVQQALAKALVPAWLIAAIVIDSPGTSAGLLVGIGLGFALVGDVLLLPQLDRFVPGLAAFLLAHLLFIPLAVAVGLYIVVLTAMVLAGVSTGAWLAIAGSLVFAASDGVLGWNRFVRPIDHGQLKTHMLYHPALILITLWAVS